MTTKFTGNRAQASNSSTWGREAGESGVQGHFPEWCSKSLATRDSFLFSVFESCLNLSSSGVKYSG